jgi:hypothetical protein
VSHFSPREKRPSTDHVCHAIHHNFTTKTPRPAPAFPPKPLQKQGSTSAKKKARKTTVPPISFEPQIRHWLNG